MLETLIKVLKSNPFLRKNSRKAGVEGSIELGYKLSLAELKNTNIINDLFSKVVFYIYWLNSITSNTIYAPEVSKQIAKLISGLEFGYKGYKKEIKEVGKLLKADAQLIE